MDEHDLIEILRAYLERAADPSCDDVFPATELINAEVRHTPGDSASIIVSLPAFDGGVSFIVNVTQIGGD